MAADGPTAGPLRVAAYPAGRPSQSNPYTALLSAALREQGAVVDDLRFSALFRTRYDVVHVHWPEWTLDARSRRRIVTMLTALAWARRRGTRVVWTVHNLGHHEGAPTASRRAWDRYARLVDGFISLTDGGVAAARAEFPALARVPARVIPHGHYRDSYPNTTTREHARDSLELSDGAPVALFFGQVRPYKGVVELIDAFRGVDDPDARLVVAGRPVDDAIATSVRRAADADARVQLHLGLVATDDVQQYFDAADLVVLPYVETLNSGAALLALSFDRRVLGPATGAFAELSARLGDRWVTTYAGTLDAGTLRETLVSTRALPRARAPLDAFDWVAVGRATYDFYRSLLTTKSSSRR
jgi:glycosyltransferase involved in cell wall biosynthesis